MIRNQQVNNSAAEINNIIYPNQFSSATEKLMILYFWFGGGTFSIFLFYTYRWIKSVWQVDDLHKHHVEEP